MTVSAQKNRLRVPWPVVAYLAALITLVTWLGGPTLAHLLRHRQYYPAAERIAEELKTLVQSADSLDRSTISKALATDRYRHLEKLRMRHDADADDLLWLQVNDMYSVGVGQDGAILWMIDGQRPNR